MSLNYLDGFVAAVALANKAAYLQHAADIAVLMKECGAVSCVENWEDDVPEGKLTSFPMAVKREAGEAVVFSWIEWPSKAVRDAGWAKAMSDPRMDPKEASQPPFDGKRMIFGGFQTVLRT